MKKLILLLAAVGMVFTACEGGLGNEENGGTPSTPKIELSQKTIDVGYEDATYSVLVTSPYSWKAESDSEWIVVDSKTGIAGDEKLRFTTLRNDEELERKGTILLTNTTYNLATELYVIQKAFEPKITIEPKTLNFAVEGGTQDITITANFEYEVSKNADWVTFVKTPNSITVTVPNYAEEEVRTAEITISNEKYNISKTIKVTQSAFEPKLHVAPSEISFTADGGSQKASVTANCEYTISTTADWISHAKTENVITITVFNNEDIEARSAEIIVSSEKYNVSKTIKVTQAAFVPKFEISTTTTSYEYDYRGGEFTVAITSNFAYYVTKTANWVECTKTANGITVRVPSYAEVENRSANIVISNEKYNISEVIKVSQTAFVPKLEISVTSTSYECDYKGDEFTVAITSNFDYDVTTTANWVTCIKDAEGVKISVQKNNYTETRTAEVKIYSERYNLNGKTISIMQDASPIEIGAIVTKNGARGVVFYINGETTKIVSVEQGYELKWSETHQYQDAPDRNNGANNMKNIMGGILWEDYYPAFKWCSDYGAGGWYLPAINELEKIYNESSTINATLKANGYPELYGWYWSSTDHWSQFDYAYGAFINYGSYGVEYRYEGLGGRVLAVLAF